VTGRSEKGITNNQQTDKVDGNLIQVE